MAMTSMWFIIQWRHIQKHCSTAGCSLTRSDLWECARVSSPFACHGNSERWHGSQHTSFRGKWDVTRKTKHQYASYVTFHLKLRAVTSSVGFLLVVDAIFYLMQLNMSCDRFSQHILQIKSCSQLENVFLMFCRLHQVPCRSNSKAWR